MSPPRKSAFDLTGDVAIVSGAGSRLKGEIGNGRACAILLARQGAKVALFDLNEEWARDTKDMIDAEGGVSEVVQVDVTDEASVHLAVGKVVDIFGRVDILVNIGLPILINRQSHGYDTDKLASWCGRRNG